VLDPLAVTRTRRLAILELKATQNPDLPLQAADFWTRIRRHQAQGDLTRYGYVHGIELQAAPPVVYLVAPALRFQATTATILSYLTPEMEVIRVGVAESWRRGLPSCCATKRIAIFFFLLPSNGLAFLRNRCRIH
jgi:hypothetical protein